MSDIEPCPVCGSVPDVEPCEPWPKDAGPQAWYVGCYRQQPVEHFRGVNGDDRADALKNWSKLVSEAAE